MQLTDKLIKFLGKKKMTPLAHPRHTVYLLPLLPSGPGGVHSTKLRGYQWSHQARIIPKVSMFSSIVFKHIQTFTSLYLHLLRSTYK